jgi:tripartite-type tricarboxylate transporter receptor subunit TctC
MVRDSGRNDAQGRNTMLTKTQSVRRGALSLAVAAVAALAGIGGARAQQSVADFYKGKTVTIYSGHSAAGAYSAYARLLEQHIGRHIPGNPNTIMKIMEGATGLTLANWLYNVAPKDGLAFGIFHERMGLEPVVAPQGTRFDGRKFTWLGSLAKQTSVCFTWHASKVRSIEDAKNIAIPVGSDAAAASDSVMPRMMNAMLGTKFKIIRGYPGSEIPLAMERGEVEGRCGFGWASLKTTRPQWIADKKVHMLAQFSFKAHPELPQVPVLMDLVQNPDDKRALELVFATQEMGRPFAAPPDIPADRAAALRKALLDVAKDPSFLEDARKQNLEVDPISGEEITDLLVRLYETPKEIAERVNRFRSGGEGETELKSK